MDITRHASVDEFFHEVVVQALASLQVEACESTEHYLVGLLGDFTKARIPDEPLSVKLVQTDRPEDRVKTLKQVGDTSLYITGFFSESLGRRLIDADYYMELGESAYRELAWRMAGSRTFHEVYEELAAKFPRFVDVLHSIRQQVNFAGSDVVQLYQEWLRTRSEWVERRLRQLGLIVPGTDRWKQ